MISQEPDPALFPRVASCHLLKDAPAGVRPLWGTLMLPVLSHSEIWNLLLPLVETFLHCNLLSPTPLTLQFTAPKRTSRTLTLSGTPQTHKSLLYVLSIHAFPLAHHTLLSLLSFPKGTGHVLSHLAYSQDRALLPHIALLSIWNIGWSFSHQKDPYVYLCNRFSNLPCPHWHPSKSQP